ncbi:hypothetical protein [Pseudonocardia sp.]|uniref:hypothetical protein n=1 Tax=Pseudonocardia sp. TaxID=60912 RepID=UPI0026275822|nr:hypothetical protein [Pseudonocardia sp.]
MDMNADNGNRNIMLDALISEADRLGSAIAERHAAAERFVAVAGALAGVGLTLGLYQNQKQILAALPIVIVVVYLYMIQIYTDAGMHSGYRQAIEERVNRELGAVVLVGQSRVAVGHSRRRSIPWTFGLVILIWIGTLVSGGVALVELTRDTSRVIWLAAYIGVIGIALYALLVAMRENVNAENRARALAEQSWTSTSGGDDSP